VLELEQVEWSKSWPAREIAAKDRMEHPICLWSRGVLTKASHLGVCVFHLHLLYAIQRISMVHDGSEALDFKEICDVVVFSELDVLRKLQEALFRATRAVLRLSAQC
jgi:hypothetical protein